MERLMHTIVLLLSYFRLYERRAGAYFICAYARDIVREGFTLCLLKILHPKLERDKDCNAPSNPSDVVCFCQIDTRSCKKYNTTSWVMVASNN